MNRWRRGFPKGDPDLVLPAAYYEQIYAEDLHQQKGTFRPWSKQPGKFLWWATAALADPPVLDVGCGPGHLAALYAALGRKNDYAGGLDYSRSAIALAEHHAPWAHFGLGDARGHRELLTRGHYETAVFLEVLEHVYRDLELLGRVPTDRLVVASVPSFPTDGHCRWFANAKQVSDRYGELLEIDRVIVEQGIESDNRWFLMKGRRR